MLGRTAAARPSIVGERNKSDSDIWVPRFSRIRSSNSIADSELPPSSKKLARTFTVGTFNVVFQMSTSSTSTGDSGRSPSSCWAGGGGKGAREGGSIDLAVR